MKSENHGVEGVPAMVDQASDVGQATRRGFLLLSMLALAGCAGSGRDTSVMNLPMEWPDAPPPSKPVLNVPTQPAAPKQVAVVESCPAPGVIPRSRWAKGMPNYSHMDRMPQPIKYITVHHDGMPAFWGTSEAQCAGRIEFIRNSHTQGRDFADIGYHYIVDRSGRVWEGRPLTFQGAHVKNHNENNIGVLCMGNFDIQTPTDPQFKSLCRHVAMLASQYRVDKRNIRTHQEWYDAKTACPGRSLQRKFKPVRDNGSLLV